MAPAIKKMRVFHFKAQTCAIGLCCLATLLCLPIQAQAYGISGHYLDEYSHLRVTLAQFGDEVFGHLMPASGFVLPFYGTIREADDVLELSAQSEDGKMMISASLFEDSLVLFLSDDEVSEKRRLYRLTLQPVWLNGSCMLGAMCLLFMMI